MAHAASRCPSIVCLYTHQSEARHSVQEWLAASARASGPASSSTAGLPPAVTPVFLGLFVSVIFIAQHLRTQFVFRKLGELFVETLTSC